MRTNPEILGQIMLRTNGSSGVKTINNFKHDPRGWICQTFTSTVQRALAFLGSFEPDGQRFIPEMTGGRPTSDIDRVKGGGV